MIQALYRFSRQLLRSLCAIAVCSIILVSFAPAAHAGVVAIKAVDNNSSNDVLLFNGENNGNSFVVDRNRYRDLDLWISAHKDRPLYIETSNGLYELWNEDWYIHYKLNGGDEHGLIYIDGAWGNEDVTAEIHSSGDISLQKR